MPEGPFGGPRPLAKEDIFYNANIDVLESEEEDVRRDIFHGAEALNTFLMSLDSQQPEIDIARGEIYRYDSFGDVYYEIDLKMTEPVVVFSHVEDAGRVMEDERSGFKLDDSRVLTKGLLRDERDEGRDKGWITGSISTQAIL